MLKNKGGFTLIELVMIIVILGILAAVAIPRYADLSRTARGSACDGLMGAMSSGISIDWIASITGTTVGYVGGPYGTGLETFGEADDTLEAGTTIPAYLLQTSDTQWNCDLDVDTTADTGEIRYTLTVASTGPPSAPAYITRSTIP